MSDAASDWFPLDPEEHEAQLGALRRRLGSGARRVLDIGAGDGRVARPLGADGLEVVALDRDPAALRACAGENVETVEGDARESEVLRGLEAPFDAVLCLGHTFMLFADPGEALDLLRGVRDLLSPEGFFAIDAFPRALWREVAEGNWQEGLSEDGSMQLVWSAGDNVIALREGEAVRAEDWSIGEGDERLRLWTVGELSLLAMGAGYRGPEEHASENLMLFFPDAGAGWGGVRG